MIANLTRTRTPAVSTTGHGSLVDHRPGAYVIAIDAHARWATVVTVVDAIRDTGARDVVLVVRATGSALAVPSAKLAPPETVFAHCPEIQAWLPSLASADDRAKRIVAELPPLVARCDCNADLGAARRMLWAWWGRDLANAPTAGVTLVLDRDGSPLAASATDEWSTVAERVVAAARRGRPAQLVAR